MVQETPRQGLEDAASLRQILDALPDGLFTMDKKGYVTYFNAMAERITGLAASDAIGLHCRKIFKSTIYESSSIPQKGEENSKNGYNREFRATRWDGKEIYIISSISVLRDHRGKVVGGLEVFRDLASRKALEDDLRASEKKYRRIFETSKDMVFITTKDGLFEDVNQAGVDLLGYESKEDLLSLSSSEMTYANPMHRKVLQKEMERYGYVKDFEAPFKKKDGTPLHCLVSGNAIRDGKGEIVGYEGIIKDITARMDAVRDLQKRHQELSLLNSVALVMNMTQNLDDILLTALKKVLEVLNLNSGGIFLINHENAALALRVRQGLPEWAAGDTGQIRLHDHLLLQSLLKKDFVLTPKSTFLPFKAAMTEKNGTGALELSCFLITAKEKASGFIALDLPPHKDLTRHDLHLLGSLGNFLGGAIENSHLLQTIQEHREELKELTAKLFHSQEFERKRLARELHDDAGQALTGINFSLETITKRLPPELHEIKELFLETKEQINRTYQGMRRLSHRLHPALLTDLGLAPALDAYLTHISKHCGLKIEFQMVGFDKRLDPDIETVLYRISQEALTNTLKHAHAKQFKLSMIRSYPNIIFLAEDDGCGFDAGRLNKRRTALGLVSMRERAAMVGGSFAMHTAPGEGTRIRIEISIKDEKI